MAAVILHKLAQHCLRRISLQVIAYNKIDLPDSGDYADEVREFLLGRGLAPEDVHATSAVTGQGVLGVVRRARQVLDAMPTEASAIPPSSGPASYGTCRFRTKGIVDACWRAWHSS